MDTQTAGAAAHLFSELVDGATTQGGAFVLNSGDLGLLRSLDTVSAAQDKARLEKKFLMMTEFASATRR